MYKAILLLLFIVSVTSSIEITPLKSFLNVDTTDQHEYSKQYSCGHFSRDLEINATKHNLLIGTVLLGMDQGFDSVENHIMNYMFDDGLIIIDPQTDQLMSLDNTGYDYYLLFPIGDPAPSTWYDDFMGIPISDNPY